MRWRLYVPAMEARIVEAWEALYGHEPASVDYEHGQWWVQAAGKTFSVVDSSGGSPSVECDGFAFEEC
jgi:hypothetical protein